MGMEMSKEEQEKVDEIVHAASNGDFDVVKENLIEMNGKDSSGDTPLHVSALNGHLNIVQLLVEQGNALEIDPRDHDNTTPLMHACNNGYYEIALLLLKAGAKHSNFDRMGWTPLHHSAASGHSNCVKLLIKEYNSDPFAIDYEANTPLHLAVHGLEKHHDEKENEMESEEAPDFVETIKLLLFESAACPLLRNHDGYTPMEILEDMEETEDVTKVKKYLERAIKAWNETSDMNKEAWKMEESRASISEQITPYLQPLLTVMEKTKNAMFSTGNVNGIETRLEKDINQDEPIEAMEDSSKHRERMRDIRQEVYDSLRKHL